MVAGREVPPASAGFSYAQAAKGRNSTTAKVESSTQSKNVETKPSIAQDQQDTAATMPEVVNGSWADDAADAVTAVEEQAQPGSQVQEQHDGHGSEKLTNGEAHTETQSHVATESLAESSVPPSKPKEEEPAQPTYTQNPDELSWRRKSSPKEEAPADRRRPGSQKQKNQDSVEAEKSAPAPAPLVEAPAPTVNFWTQRAQEAKKKPAPNPTQHQAITPPPASVPISTAFTEGSKGPSQPATRSEESRSKSMTAPGARENHFDSSTPEFRRPSISGRGRARNSVGAGRDRGNSVRQPTVPSTAQFPSLQDSKSWPAPESKQDEDRKKAHNKSHESTDNDAQTSSNNKPHGKQEWVSMPFVPSVKFETPIPSKTGRPARGGARGGRGDSMGRGGPHAGVPNTRGAPSTSGESTNATVSRDRSASSAVRAPATAATIGLANGTSEHPSQRRPSAQAEDPRPLHRQSERASNVAGSESMEQANADASTKPAPTSAVNGEAPTSQHEASRNSISKHNDAKSRRRGSRAADTDGAYVPRNGDRKRSGSLSANGKPSWSDRRSEYPARSFDATKEAPNGLPFRERGEGRPERGRGGRHRGGFHGSHPPSSLQINNSHNHHAGPLHSAKSATFHFSNPVPYPSRGRGGPRSASIPHEASFGRFPQHYAGAHYYAQSPYVGPGAYESGSMTPTNPAGVMYPTMDMMLTNGVAAQLNYYFSLENLLKDMYLRKQMDSQGFVSLRLIAGFARLRNMTTDFELIKFIAQQNGELEVFHGSQQGDPLVRKREGWQNYVLPKDQREPAAQNDGPDMSQQDRQVPNFTCPAFNGHSTGREFHSLQPMYAGHYQGFTPMPTASPVNGYPRSPANNRYSMSAFDSQNGHSNNSPSENFTPSQRSNDQHDEDDDEPDSYPDEGVSTELTIVSRLPQEKVPQPHESRSFSNGTIDGAFAGAQTNGDDAHAHAPTQVNGVEPSDHSAKVAEIKEKLSSPAPRHRSSNSRTSTSPVYWMKGQKDPVNPPPDAETYPYVQICANAKQQREIAGPGGSHHMDVLYNFWSHFLLRNFNRNMYNDFKIFALDDAKHGSRVGLDRLLDYYDQALLSQDRPIRRRVACDYVEQVKLEDANGDGLIFKRLRAAWRNGGMNLKSRKILQELVDADLKSSLDR